MKFLEGIAGKVVTAVLALAVLAGGVAFWQAGPDGREAFFRVGGIVLGWIVGVALLPWATFFLSVKAGKAGNNAISGLLIAGYVAVELVVLLWLFEWDMGGGVGWTFFVVGGLLAAVYNLLACDWIAEKLG